MAEKSLATSHKDADAGATINREAMVRGVLRALEQLGLEEPASQPSVEIEELEEEASSLRLPRLSAASLPAIVLRRPREADAICAGSASATAPSGAAAIEAGGLPAASTPTERPQEAATGPRKMAEHWASVERRFEEAHAARRQAQALEDAALAAWDGYLEVFHCGREIAGIWPARIKYLQEERALIAGARRVREERREAEEAAKHAEEESRAAALEARRAYERAEEARQRQQEASRRAREVEAAVRPAQASRSRRRCYYCGCWGVSSDRNCPNVASHDPSRPWFLHRLE